MYIIVYIYMYCYLFVVLNHRFHIARCSQRYSELMSNCPPGCGFGIGRSSGKSVLIPRLDKPPPEPPKPPPGPPKPLPGQSEMSQGDWK